MHTKTRNCWQRKCILPEVQKASLGSHQPTTAFEGLLWWDIDLATREMKIDIKLVIYWGLIPLINFLLWFYVSKTRMFSKTGSPCPVSHTEEDSLKALLEQSLLELQAESMAQPCDVGQTISEQEPICNRFVSLDNDAFVVTLENTDKFDEYRQERLASMTLSLVLKTYTERDTIVLHYRGRKEHRHQNPSDECLHLDHHFVDNKEATCMAVVYLENANNTYDVSRVDSDIDLYGLSISNPDPSQIDKYSTKYKFNEHNANKLWPTGFFRKVPKEKGRIRMKEKLGTFLKHYDSMQVSKTLLPSLSIPSSLAANFPPRMS